MDKEGVEEDSGNPPVSSIYNPTKTEETVMAPVATLGDDNDEYLDTDTGKMVRMPKPCCGCRAFDHRFSLEMDEENSKVYREARFCNLSYAFISAWCVMLFFGTVASAGIIAVGFLDIELIQYQVVGIVLIIIFGGALPVFVVFWVGLQKRAQEIKRQYHAEKNIEQVFNQEMEQPLQKAKDEDEAGDEEDRDEDEAEDDEDSGDLSKPAEYIPPPGPPAPGPPLPSEEDLRRMEKELDM